MSPSSAKTFVPRAERIRKEEFVALIQYGEKTVFVTGGLTIDTSYSGIGVLSPVAMKRGDEFAVEWTSEGGNASRRHYEVVYCLPVTSASFRVGGLAKSPLVPSSSSKA